MKITDINLDNIIEGNIWKVTDPRDDNINNWKVKKVIKINSKDIIFHSAVMVGTDKIYPVLISKYYEDGGEVGEYLIYSDGSFFHLGVDKIDIDEITEGPYYSYISTLDIHEYQKGSFDNRKINFDKFHFYIGQIKNKIVMRFQDKKNILPKQYFSMDEDGLFNNLVNLLSEYELLCKDYSNVSKLNKTSVKIIAILDLYKQKFKSDKLLNLLENSNDFIKGALAYNLADIYDKTCFKIIKKISKQNTTIP